MIVMRKRRRGIFQGFRGRLFLWLAGAVAALTLLISVAILGFQRQMLLGQIIEQGTTMTELLSDNLRLGVFSENPELLSAPITAMLKQQDVIKVAVFNDRGELLSQGAKPMADEATLKTVEFSDNIESIVSGFENHARHGFFLENDQAFMFWEPVLIESGTYSPDALYFDEQPQQRRQEVVGYVAVALSKHHYRAAKRALLLRIALVAGATLLIGVAAIFFILRASTQPLADLLAEIRQHGVPVDTMDELGMLSDTYSAMVESLGESFETINSLKNNLEKRVEDRTSELLTRQRFLEETNERLHLAMRELREAQAQVVQSEKMAALGQLVAGVAHEINNTVNFISGALPLLQRRLQALAGPDEEALDSEQAKAKGQIDTLLANIEEGVRRTTGIVRDLQTFSRIEGGERKPFDIHEGLESTLALLHHQYKNRIEIVHDYGEAIEPVACQADQINQVFMNILVNAIQAIPAPDRGTITIRTWQIGDEVHISIKDTGCGIPAELTTRIFDPFFTTKEVGKGTGLGLGISFQIVKQHQGEIRVRSKQGEGSEFEIVLPVRPRFGRKKSEDT